MSEQGISIPQTTLATSASAIPPARPAATRTKLLLEGPILATLLRLAAPNVLNLLAFVGVITFLGKSERTRSQMHHLRFRGSC